MLSGNVFINYLISLKSLLKGPSKWSQKLPQKRAQINGPQKGTTKRDARKKGCQKDLFKTPPKNTYMQVVHQMVASMWGKLFTLQQQQEEEVGGCKDFHVNVFQPYWRVLNVTGHKEQKEIMQNKFFKEVCIIGPIFKFKKRKLLVFL